MAVQECKMHFPHSVNDSAAAAAPTAGINDDFFYTLGQSFAA